MDAELDHYIILGLPSGEEGAQISEKDITKAYKKKALELHPDKRRDDRQAHADTQQLIASYAILKDEKARKLFDSLLRVKHENVRRQSQQNSKRQRMMFDLEEREHAAFASDSGATKAWDEEEKIARQLKEEIARIRAMHANKVASVSSPQITEATVGRERMDGGGRSGLDKERVLKVSWEKIGEDYSAQRLRELFEKFGEVEEVVLSSSKKRGSALLVMASKDAVVAATGSVCGDISNPLLVLPLQPAIANDFQSPLRDVEPDDPKLSNLMGAGYKSFEDSVLKKMMQKGWCKIFFLGTLLQKRCPYFQGDLVTAKLCCSLSHFSSSQQHDNSMAILDVGYERHREHQSEGFR